MTGPIIFKPKVNAVGTVVNPPAPVETDEADAPNKES